MRTNVYISEYQTQICINDSIFSEIIHDTKGSQFKSEYITNFKIIIREKDELVLLNDKSNEYFGGKYSNMHFIKGKICLNGVKIHYFAFYFGSYDKLNLLEVKSLREKDVEKYTWSVNHKIGDTTKTVDQLAALAKQVKASYIEKKKRKIRCDSLQFFNKKFHLPIILIPNSIIIDYSPSLSDIIQYGNGNKVGCFVAKVERKEEDLANKYNLQFFHMLYGFNIKTNDVIMGSNIRLSMEYLRDFCKADMGSIGIVSITDKNKLGIPGIEQFIPTFLIYGIKVKNIMIRYDVEEAFIAGTGDGYWRTQRKDTKLEGTTYSVQFPLIVDADIKDYHDKNKWVELAECGLGDSTNSFKSVAFGLERIEYAMFGLPYPSNK